ncbi:MAG: acyl-CoA reductase [Verrucomicrobiota bacterium]
MSKAVEQLMALPVFSTSVADKEQALLHALQESLLHHLQTCPAFAHYAKARGVTAETMPEALADFPFLPVQAFKHNAAVLRSVPEEAVRAVLHSSATSGVPSTIPVDKVTAKRQVKALAAVLEAVFGGQRRPFIVLDVDPRGGSAAQMGARHAAVQGFLNLAREVSYVMRADTTGQLTLDTDALQAALEQARAAGEPVVIFGFTYVVYAYVVEAMLAAEIQTPLPAGSFVAHIGGWKKLADHSVDAARFKADVGQVFGLEPAQIVDFYGFTEQMGITYPDAPGGDKCCPVFAEVLVRDPLTHAPLPDGEEGLLEFITPLPFSYPGIAVLTDDMGVITGRAGANGWQGTRFRVTGRAKRAEARGCGDIMGEKLARPQISSPAAAAVGPGDCRLLFDGSQNAVEGDWREPVERAKLPQIDDLNGLAQQLKQARAKLDAYSIDELIALIGAAADRWAAVDSPLAGLRQQGLQYLISWCSPDALRRTADASLRGHRGYLDGFKPIGTDARRMWLARPRGLVCHWLSGNVPLLAMLSLAQSILCRNANLLKTASQFSRTLPLLLDAFRGLEVETASGRVLLGDDVLASIAVVYFSRDDQASAQVFSSAADVRLAWGGREAMEGILELPRALGSEDILFGPKLSFMVIGRERLESGRALQKLLRAAATDASVFDQYACSSPHTIFVETGGGLSPEAFAEGLADEMEKALGRIPRTEDDPAAAAQVAALRLQAELTGRVWSGEGGAWTVIYDPSDLNRAAPSYARTITVKPVDSVEEVLEQITPEIQTVGLAMSGERRLRFAESAALRGAERFPDVGRMTFFDSPWDGLFPMERLVKWVPLGGPL